jgi:hypothetical protein
MNDPVPELMQLLGSPVVFLAWPRGSKGFRRKWGHLTADDMTSDYLSKLQHGNIGVALGEKSGGLVAIDCDDDNFLKSFAAANPKLADTLQTHGARGRVFWLRMAGSYPTKSLKLKTTTKTDVGEYRANGNQSIVWGIHPETHKPYQFVVRKPALTVDFASINWPSTLAKTPATAKWTEVTEGTDVAEEADVTDVAECSREAKVIGSPGSLFSLIDSVEDAVNKCLPEITHENNARLFDLARGCLTLKTKGIRHDPEAIFDLWHERAKQLLRPDLTKEDYYIEFMNACHRAKVPLGSAMVASAWQRANQNPLPLPPKAMAWENQERKKLLAFFREMQIAAGDEKWFVAGGLRTCAKLLGHNSHSTVEKWIGAFCGMKFLKVVEKGDAHRATRFRYLCPLAA